MLENGADPNGYIYVFANGGPSVKMSPMGEAFLHSMYRMQLLNQSLKIEFCTNNSYENVCCNRLDEGEEIIDLLIEHGVDVCIVMQS